MASRRGRVSPAAFVPILAFVAIYLVIAANFDLPGWLPFAYLALSVVTFLVYAIDKSAAVAGRPRVSEAALLILGLIGGWPGAIVAQQALRHKTVKTSFLVSFWGTVVIHILAFAAFFFLDVPELLVS